MSIRERLVDLCYFVVPNAMMYGGILIGANELTHENPSIVTIISGAAMYAGSSSIYTRWVAINEKHKLRRELSEETRNLNSSRSREISGRN